jgi:hypothetical protein
VQRAAPALGQGVHHLTVEVVDAAPCEQTIGDRALKRRARLELLHIEFPAYELQAGLPKLGDRLEDLPDRQHHRADRRYRCPRGAPADGRIPPVAAPAWPSGAPSAGQSTGSTWTYGRQPLNDRARRCPGTIG